MDRREFVNSTVRAALATAGFRIVDTSSQNDFNVEAASPVGYYVAVTTGSAVTDAAVIMSGGRTKGRASVSNQLPADVIADIIAALAR